MVRPALDDILECLLKILILPQPSCASMTGPSLSIRSIVLQAVEFPAGVRLEFVHDFLGSYIGFHNRMYVVGPHVRGQQTPTAMRAVPAQSRKDGCPTLPVQPIGRLQHTLTLG